MPAIADIIVKKADGTTNVTYTAVVPSSGDKTPAVWKCNTMGASAAQRAELRMFSQDNGPKTARRLDMSYMYPSVFTELSTGKVSIDNRGVFSFSIVVPKGMPDTDVNEFVAQGQNLLNSALIVACLKAGYSPT